ncbi:polymorphic toxin-type HINT domain-containing protein, partial [Streptomyces sp. NPDC056161]|uniref:polymorphic toxin-type HINT domain-containing protein n=1 Tax=Streptomyces sp. NPDC056161 TaxID=3345732 RepID=UPI0035E0AF82
RQAAQKARDAAKGAKKAADAADQAGVAADNAAKAAGAAASAGVNAAAAAAAAADADRWAVEAGAQGTKAAAAAARAKRLADQASRAAASAQANANQAAVAARQSRDAANDAAAHAEAAATAADKAADEAGHAVDAAAAATAAANAATESANNATKAAEQAAGVIDLARKADAERLAQQQEEAVLAAEEANAMYEAKQAEQKYEIGKLAELDAQTRTLVTEAAASSDPAVTAAKGRQAALNLMGGGTWVSDAAETALSGDDAEVGEFVRTRLAVAMEQDDRAGVAHIAATTTIPAQQQAALDVLDQPVEQVREFLRTRAYPGKEDDDRVAAAKIASEGGPGVKAAASKALDGTPADVVEFLERGQYAAREDDDRVSVAQALATGGPEVQAAAQAALSGPPDGLRTFLEIGLYKARQRDANAAAHIAEVNTLLQAAYKSASLAQKDAALAQKLAAEARKNAAEAVSWANKAQQSADQAAGYAKQADASADQAAKSAADAAESARTAQDAAASAQNAARSAAHSAERAEHSAAVAGDYAYEAGISAYQAGISAEAAGKDATAAAAAATDAMKIAADKLVAELKAQIEEEAQQTSKPLSDDELRRSLEKRLVEYRSQYVIGNEDWKSGDVLLVCGGDGAGGMGCISSTYLDRLIAWYVGADEIEKCLTGKSLTCLDDLALSALKFKFLKRSPCGKSSFVPGTRVLLAGGGTKAIEDVQVGDRVVATDPGTGRTRAEPVVDTITSRGAKNLVTVTVPAAGAGRGGSVTATDKHQFWAADSGSWTEAADLTAGTRLRTPQGARVPVGAVSERAAPDQRVHNLTVAELHSYYVLAGGTPVLVHNDRCPNGRLSDKLPKGMSNEIAAAYDLYKEGKLVSHDVYNGNEWPKWEGALEYAVPGAGNNERILVKTLPNGIEMIGWTSTHYQKIQRFTAPHFPDWGWKK